MVNKTNNPTLFDAFWQKKTAPGAILPRAQLSHVSIDGYNLSFTINACIIYPAPY